MPRAMRPPLPAELAVVIPCYNEAANVAPLVAALDSALVGIAWEAVFVDDDSPDGTAAEARRLAAADPRIRAIRRVGRRGLASACIEGMLATSAPFIAVIDGDLQHDEAALPAMLAAVRAGADIAIGSRHVEGGAVGEGLSAIRARVSGLGGWAARLLLPVPVSDPMSGFFLLRREVIEAAAPRLTGRGFKILLDILLSSRRVPKVAEIPYVFRARTAGESKLDALVLLDFAGLLLDKWFGGLLPLRFIGFALVGAVGVLVHLAVLSMAVRTLDFAAAQWVATLVAMTANFWLNNSLTYRSVRLRGRALWRGLVLFYLVCGLGAVANVGISSMLLQEGRAGWPLAGAAGALLTGVWNYAVSSTLVWRAR
ncbi:dolichol-phosphate mannosyltransferase [Humitalea rosea]|uniref:Dolichol-phosphate mannosyltransferase n=2 Tax=Humitalea rosea TaxID=990373 RepID=A0A2W7ITZ2_9PROT|nr:dolichol-phosphate mannosyltransferase [Humitalea rosea]